MPTYEFACDHCGSVALSQHSFEEDTFSLTFCCHNCQSGTLRRQVSSFGIISGVDGHYNHSLGRYVTGMRDFKSGLARKSDQMTERTGIPHNYEPIDHMEKKALGVTEEGLDSTRAAEMAQGKREARKWL